MDSLIFDLQIVFYFQLFLSANVRHTDYGFLLNGLKTLFKAIQSTLRSLDILKAF